MKTEQTNHSIRIALHILAGVILGLGAATQACHAAQPDSGQNENPGIIPPHATYRGLTYGEWGAMWWISMFSYPVVNGHHPYLDGGAFEGHNGVMFMAALPGGATIDVTVPSGTPLFVPVIDVECSVFEPEPFHGDTEGELRACANAYIDNASDLLLIVDGQEVQNLQAYRFESPLFEFTLPADNLFAYFGLDAPAGTTSPSVDAGIYVMLAPLSVGEHTIQVAGTIEELAFSIDTTFNITVVPVGQSE